MLWDDDDDGDHVDIASTNLVRPKGIAPELMLQPATPGDYLDAAADIIAVDDGDGDYLDEAAAAVGALSPFEDSSK